MAEYWKLIEGKVIHIFDMDGNRICQSRDSVPVRGGSRLKPLTNECKYPGSDEFVFFRGDGHGPGIVLVGLYHDGGSETLYVLNGDRGVLTQDQVIVGITHNIEDDYFQRDSRNMFTWMPHVIDFDETTQSGWFNWTTTGGLSVIESDAKSTNGNSIPVLSVASRPATTEDPFRFQVVRSLNSLQSLNLLNSLNSSASSAAAVRPHPRDKAPEVSVDGSGRVRIKISQC